MGTPQRFSHGNGQFLKLKITLGAHHQSAAGKPLLYRPPPSPVMLVCHSR